MVTLHPYTAMSQSSKYLDQENILDASALSSTKQRISHEGGKPLVPLKRSATTGPYGNAPKRKPKHVLGGKDVNTKIPVLRKSQSTVGGGSGIRPHPQKSVSRSASAIDTFHRDDPVASLKQEVVLDFKHLQDTSSISPGPSVPYTDSLVKLEFTNELPRVPSLATIPKPQLGPPVASPRLNTTNMDPRKRISKNLPSDVDRLMNDKLNKRIIGKVPSYLIDDPNSIETIAEHKEEELKLLGEEALHFLRLPNITLVTKENYYEYPDLRKNENALKFEEISLEDHFDKEDSGEQDMSLDDVGLSVDDLNELLE